ncbi:hypothetical protein C1752_02793 [Acaryochloris thomasi RCC1774]|uniref:Uncharacterized protein n=1 Tax=Acaryochloris thomasi RCC1774 TaxID=1764569 RepID=A0A2W1JHT3_9CYAN|nr:hypothetical protein [Acaryochloris thomasi]PZD73123.1 hypothetical protein C1752_02793 [Acaryochloris thomasi RCC1774]
MSMQIEGTLKYQNIGVGAWSLVSSDETYELYQAPEALQLAEGAQVTVTGQVREDIMTLAMIGPVLEVEDYQILKEPEA